MSRFFGKDIIAISLSVFLWCFTVTTTSQIDFLIPQWMKHLPDEKLTGVPKHMIQLQNKIYYPVRSVLQKMFTSNRRINISRKLQKTQRRILKSTNFMCNTNGTRSPTRPTSVHELRPGDIDIVGSVGDSLTVGTGSFSFIFADLLTEERGVSWTAGGQGSWKEFLTLPNIIKEFNPKLIGYARSHSLTENTNAQFNVAEIGALSKDIPYMTRELVKRIKMDKRIDVNNDWKLISIMMGSNTFCLELCYEDYTVYPEKHKESIMEALNYIKDNLPRTIVNLIMSPSLTILKNFTNLPLFCDLIHIAECPCLFATQYKHHFSEYYKVMKNFQAVEKEIANNEGLRNKDDFAVVLQPFTEHLKFPVNQLNTTDITYLSTDCFHFSQKGYARAANALWNNMMEPVGNKTTDWSKEFDRFLCPTPESPYIRTWKNSII